VLESGGLRPAAFFVSARLAFDIPFDSHEQWPAMSDPAENLQRQAAAFHRQGRYREAIDAIVASWR
jgi:hypothetical protein